LSAEITALREEINGFGGVMSGKPVGSGDFPNGKPQVVAKRGIHQDAQGIIREKSQLHGFRAFALLM